MDHGSRILKMVLTGSMGLASLLGLGGCPAVLVGAGAAGTVAYMKGALQSVEPHSMEGVVKASEKTLIEMSMPLLDMSKDSMSAKITSRTAENKDVRIQLEKVNEGTTNISIRVGIFGDEIKARQIYQRIHDLLQ